MLLVVISWVSFWLNREATSDRISLGELNYWYPCHLTNFDQQLDQVNIPTWIIFRNYNRSHNDIYGTGGKKRFTQSHISDSFGLFCVHFFHVHFLNCCAGLVRNKLNIFSDLKYFFSLAWFTTLPSLAQESIIWRNWKMKSVGKMIF